MLCACGCQRPVSGHEGKGRPNQYSSGACRVRHHRAMQRGNIVTSGGTTIEPDGVTKMINSILCGDALAELKKLPDRWVQMCVTSPPYFGLRSYLPDEHPDKPLEVGLEETPEQYVSRLVIILREVRRVLRSDGVLWLNLGDSYTGSGKGGQPTMYSQHWQPTYPKIGTIYPGLAAKQLLGIPWRVALALQAEGWYLRSDVIWHKVNCVPESARDRPTKSHEYVFLFSK